MPGFTAEASLCATDGCYYAVSNNNALDTSKQILPQRIFKPPVDCDSMECYQSGGYMVCYCS